MKQINKQILEAINKGIQLALDDYEDDINTPSSKSNIIKNIDSKDLWDLHNCFVDLGLPSRTLWAKFNLGCDWDKLNKDPEHAKPEDWYGNYYAWGELTPKTNFSQETYKFRTTNIVKFTKYNEKDQLTELLPEDDAAYQYDKRFKIPSKEQFEELLKYTTNKWVRNYQKIKWLNGRLFISTINKNQLFIPASGYHDESLKLKLRYVGSRCYSWSSSLDVDYHHIAHNLYFDSHEICNNFGSRGAGLSIRPVLY